MSGGMGMAGPLMSPASCLGNRTTDVETRTFVVTGPITGRSPSRLDDACAGTGQLVPEHYYVEDHEDGTLRANGVDGKPRVDKQPLVAYSIVPESGQGADLRASRIDVADSLTRMERGPHDRGVRVVTHTLRSEGADASEDGTGRGTPMTLGGAGVRRLTPRECERLQALPDDWTLIDWRGKPASDSIRYSALGDAVTATVAEWIGRRILEVDS